MRGMGLRKEECVRVKKAVGGGENYTWGKKLE